MNEETFAKVIELITQRIGIIPRDSHKTGIKNYIDKRICELEEQNSVENFDYYDYLLNSTDEMMNLINSATVNETYFFREEAQFELLKSKILPEIKSKTILPIKIWSAASSSGEEIYSLFLLASSLGIRTNCTATDINTKVLDICKNGEYKKNAVRKVDGSKFQNLLEPYIQKDGSYVIPREIREKIHLRQINLSKPEELPKNQDIVFLRNVFIYFSPEMKKQILQRIADDSLVPGGYLFLSMNEVASIDSTIIPKNLEKICDGKVFYFHKSLQVAV